MRRFTFFLTVSPLVILMSACGSAMQVSVLSPPAVLSTPSPSTGTSVSAAAVPAQYQALFSALQGQINTFAAGIPAQASGSGTVVASALETADGNVMHPGILQTNVLATTTTMIRDMKAMGETGVTVQVSFPLLLQSWPDSSEYQSFYEQVAQVIHQEGMTLTVEENPLFPNISSQSVSGFYAGLTLQSFAADYQQQAQTIIDDMQPTYLSFLNEPDTYTANLHNRAIRLTDAATGVQFVNLVLSGLQRHGTQMCAGSGTWQDGSYDQALLDQTSIDCIDMHMYPVAQSDVTNMRSQVAEADAAHKPVVMSECWLYKQSTDGHVVDTATSAPNEQKDGTFSFWEPLDTAFLTAMVNYARDNHFVVISPFSTENFFAYQDWTPALESDTPTQARAAFYRVVGPALAADRLSPVGTAFAKLSSES